MSRCRRSTAGRARRALAVCVFLSIPAFALADRPAAAPVSPASPPADPLVALREGNARFRDGTAAHPRQDAGRRAATLTEGQHPHAVVLSCSDSRVPPELLFDQGVGDLFVIRVAGNVAGSDEMGSVEYGVEHLHAPVVVVLGHTACGAVTAAADGKPLPGHIGPLVAPIRPAVEDARKEHPGLAGAGLVAAAVRCNVYQQVRTLLTESEAVREAVHAGHARVVGAVYDLSTGAVEFLGPHPAQARLLGGHGGAAAGASASPHELVHDTPAPTNVGH